MVKSENISFTVKFTQSDFEETWKGWRCSAIKIPGATIQNIYSKGKVLSPDDYEINQGLEGIRWKRNTSHPQEITVLIKLTKNLSTQEDTDKWRK